MCICPTIPHSFPFPPHLLPSLLESLESAAIVFCFVQKFIKDALHHPVDLAVATPSSLLRYQKEERLWLSDLSHLVIDEADTLFDKSFIEDTLKVIKTIKLRSKKPSAAPVISEDAQVTVVGATLSQPVVKKIESLVPVRLWLKFVILFTV